MKKIGIKILLVFFSIILLAVIVSPSNVKQVDKISEFIAPKAHCPAILLKEGDFFDKVFSTKQVFKNIKGVPKQYEEVFYLTCSFYPELSDVTININYAPIPTTMQTQPMLRSMFSSRSNREYLISINSNKNFEGILFEDIPYNAQVGIIAHELAHVLDFEHKNTLNLISTGLKFTSKRSRSRFEKSIDKLTILKGFGWQLHDWAQYAMFESKATDEYKQFKKDVYLLPSEIKKIISEHPNICKDSI